MPQGLRPLAIAIVAALGAWSHPLEALELGELQLRSRIGEPLDARIPVKRRAGETLEGGCFSTLPSQSAGAAPANEVSLALRRSAGRAELHATTKDPVADPAVSFSIRIECPRSEEPPRERVFVVLPELARVARKESPASDAATFTAREGDTLASLARALAPGPAAAQARWREGVRAANPSLASVADDAPLPAATRLTLAAPTRPPVRAEPAAPAQAAERMLQPASPPASKVELPDARAESSAPKAAPPPPTVPRNPARARVAEAPLVTPRAAPAPRSPFVLKLSSAEVDLSRSARFDDRMRQELRERQMVLDADDQVSALLSMRHNLRQLETQVAQLQLRLSSLPVPATAAPVASVAAPAPALAPAPVAPAPVPIAVPRSAQDQEKVEPSSAPTSPPLQSGEAAAPSSPVAKPATAPPPPPAPAAVPGLLDRVAPWWPWGVVVLMLLLAGALLMRIAKQRRAVPFPSPDEMGSISSQHAAMDATIAGHGYAEVDLPLDARPAMDSDAALATRLPEDSGQLRRRYIEERFPEVINGTVVLDEPASVVKAARLFYEDGALPRAVELLQYAIEEHPEAVRCWLALFEIFRLERLAGEYAQLAHRFRQSHGQAEAWRKVRYFGREIDPGNPLYQEDVAVSLETIGPREARRLAAANAPVDPIAENWLDAPMDFENAVLANELRSALMGDANLRDEDLIPNPMPALRNVEMFTVA